MTRFSFVLCALALVACGSNQGHGGDDTTEDSDIATDETTDPSDDFEDEDSSLVDSGPDTVSDVPDDGPIEPDGLEDPDVPLDVDEDETGLDVTEDTVGDSVEDTLTDPADDDDAALDPTDEEPALDTVEDEPVMDVVEEEVISCTSGDCCLAGEIQAAGTVCQVSGGDCDPEETCDGISPDCPADALAPDFTPCTLITVPDYGYDICVEGVCVSPGSCSDGSCNSPGPWFPLPDTGARQCYDMSVPGTCMGTPGVDCQVTALCGQDAQYGWDTTHLSTDRFSVTEPVAEQPIVEDQVTSLVWQGCTMGFEGSDCSTWVDLNSTNWAGALEYCDSLSWGGLDDWRLPDRWEMQSMVDYGQTAPAVDPIAFPATTSSTWYWSSTRLSRTTVDEAFSVGGETGAVTTHDLTDYRYVRCVRGEPSTMASRYTRREPVLDEPVVDDAATELTWQGCVAGLRGGDCLIGAQREIHWEQTMLYCETLVWAGYSDWRMPDIKQLATIVDPTEYSPAVDPVAFPATPRFNTWSSTPVPLPSSSPTRPYLVDFTEGTVSTHYADYPHLVRCVRNTDPMVTPAILPTGDPCTGNEQCASGFCTDGVCCDSPCVGACMSCAGGSCSMYGAGTDPESECFGGSCDGAGHCDPAMSCHGLLDYTPCTIFTAVDHGYDVCSGGFCISPATCGFTYCNTPGPHFTIRDTGQRVCYDAIAELPSCPGTAGASTCGSTSMCGQDAQYGWDTLPPFTARFSRTELVTDQPIVEDLVTGLVWQGCINGQSGGDCLGGSTANITFEDALSDCDTLVWGGYDDWRLPDKWEGQSLVDYGRWDPALDTTTFPNPPAFGEFWTNSNASFSDYVRWVVDIRRGIVKGQSSTNRYARCVRGTPTPIPSPRYLRTEPVGNEPVVLDQGTGLMWQGCLRGESGMDCSIDAALTDANWTTALSYCEDLPWGGHDDWTLPDAMELGSISPFVEEVIVSTGGRDYPLFSSSSNVESPDEAWIVEPRDWYWIDAPGPENKTDAGFVVCVRHP